VSKDPIGFESGDTNHYRYVFNNPVNYIDPSGLAYFAKRPLSGFPWLGPLSCNSGSIDDISNTEISHEHLFFEDGKEPSNVGCSRKGLFTETFPQGYRCRSGKYNDCIMRKAASKVPCIYSAARSNCQDWAALVRSEYQKLEMDSKIQEECRCAK
ncbi:MAG: hypothetical protein JXR79_01690, partial [Nitrospirae bacterium]|nr:hypothetical protein [Nitrospirota bacterium]